MDGNQLCDSLFFFFCGNSCQVYGRYKRRRPQVPARNRARARLQLTEEQRQQPACQIRPPCLLAAMVAHLPRFPLLLLFVYLGVHVPAAHGDPAQPQTTTYDANICSNSMCGSVDIHYPFYMSRKRADYSGYYPCGYTGLEISCEDRGPTGTPVIQLGGHNYTVQNIFYERSAIILVDSDVLVPDKCPRVSHGVISFGEVGLRYNNSSDEALTFFFGCEAGLPDGYDMYRINCNGGKSPFGDGASFVLAPDDHGKALEQELAAYCKNLSVPVRSEVLLKVMASNSASFRSGGYGDVLKQGFELLWLPTEECHPCEQSGGKCSYNHYRQFLGCLCSHSNSKVGHPSCRPSEFFKTILRFDPLRFLHSLHCPHSRNFALVIFIS